VTDVEELIVAAVAARSRRGMSDEACQRLTVALAVPCVVPSCAAEAGVECRNLVDSGPTRFGFHDARGRAAGVDWGPSDPPDPLPVRRRPADTGHGWPVPDTAGAEQGWYRP
jgi:hypothetical protein